MSQAPASSVPSKLHLEDFKGREPYINPAQDALKPLTLVVFLKTFHPFSLFSDVSVQDWSAVVGFNAASITIEKGYHLPLTKTRQALPRSMCSPLKRKEKGKKTIMPSCVITGRQGSNLPPSTNCSALQRLLQVKLSCPWINITLFMTNPCLLPLLFLLLSPTQNHPLRHDHSHHCTTSTTPPPRHF